MTGLTFESFSQNGEDVVLWRALHDVQEGRYVDVGANHPQKFSVTMGFYARGWSGITVEPDPEFAELQREDRPRDVLIQAAATAKDGDTVTFHVVDGTGLSTLLNPVAEEHARAGHDTHDLDVPTRRLDAILEEAGWAGQDIHFMSIDTEGSEREVLEGIDLTVWRPWVLVVEATAPLSTISTRDTWESLVTDAGYRFCLFDGLSCFYVAEEHQDRLGQALSYPACPHDDYITLEHRECLEGTAGVQALVQDVARWRALAVTRWATAVANTAIADQLRANLEDLREEHAELQHQHHLLNEQAAGLHQHIGELLGSTSWRVTKPIRAVIGAFGRSKGSP